MECRGLAHLCHKLGVYKRACPLLAQLSVSNGPEDKENKWERCNYYRRKKKYGSTRGKQNVNNAYPVQERKQNNLQFVPHIVVIHLEIILGIWEVPTYLFDLCTKYQYKELECIQKNCFCTWQPRIKGTDSRIFITFIQGPWDVHEQWKSQIYFSHIKSKFQNEVEKSKWRPKITWLEVRRSEEGGDWVYDL